MTINNDNHSKSEDLLQQLEGWICIASANRHILNKNPFLEEFLAFKLEIAQGYIEELKFWEEVTNRNKCQDAFENAQFFLGQIKVLIDRMICNQHEEVLIDSQNELRFTIRVSTSHEHVLHESINNFALAG